MLHGVGLFGAGESVPGEAGDGHDGRGFPCGGGVVADQAGQVVRDPAIWIREALPWGAP